MQAIDIWIAPCDYGNEAEVGAGIRAAIEQGLCRREDLLITSKLWNTYHSRIMSAPPPSGACAIWASNILICI